MKRRNRGKITRDISCVKEFRKIVESVVRVDGDLLKLFEVFKSNKLLILK